MKINLILIFLLILHLSMGNAFSQSNFNEGRVITNNNDTLYGLIQDGGLSRNSNVCFFKETSESEIIQYYPGDIKSYLIFGDKYFVSQEVFHKNEFKKYFIEVLIEGKVDLLHFYKNDDMRYFLQQGNNELIPLINNRFITPKPSDNNYVIKVLWQEYRIDDLLYKDTLFTLIGDNIDLLYQLYHLDYEHESLMNFTKSFIASDCTGDSCVTYEKDLRKAKDEFDYYLGTNFKFGFYLGTNFIRNNINEPDFQITFPVGIVFNHPFILISERFSFQTELYYSQFSFDQEMHHKVALPILLRYRLFSKKLSPFIGVGKEIGYYFGNESYLVNRGSLLGDFGLSYTFNSKLTLYTNVRYQQFNLHLGNAKGGLDFLGQMGGPKDIQLLWIQFGIMF